MKPLVNDRWEAAFRVGELGRYGFKVQGWVDHFETWRRDLLKRIKAESDAAVDYLIGAELVAEAAGRAAAEMRVWLRERAAVLRSGKEPSELRIACDRSDAARAGAALSGQAVCDGVDRELDDCCRSGARAIQFMVRILPAFDRAQNAGVHGTFADCEKRLPYIAEMGFNVVYLPPIHPIGTNVPEGTQQQS